MCVLVALRHASEPLLVVAANRDERIDRPWTTPALLESDPPIFAGRDLVGGGTWLAVNLAAPMIVGVSNARLGAPAGERSRGELVTALARERSLAEAVALAVELDLGRYGPFNLLIADAQATWCATNVPEPLIRRQDAVAFVIANDPLDAPGERVREATRRAAAFAGEAPASARVGLQTLLAEHRGSDPLCRHGQGYGTLCSALVEVGTRRALSYSFAAGPPCVTRFEALPLPPSYS